MNFKNFYYLILLVLFSFSLASAEDNYIEILKKANYDYKIGAFNSAKEKYKKVLDSNFDNGYLHYNYANSLYRLNKIGEAIYEYRVAKSLLPRDPNIKLNLELAKSKLKEIKSKGNEHSIFYKIFVLKDIFNKYELTLICLISYILFWVGLCLVFINKNFPLLKISLPFLFILSIITIINIYCLREFRNGYRFITFKNKDIYPSIIITKTENLYATPNKNSQVIKTLIEGEEVETKKEKGSTKLIKVIQKNKDTAWLPAYSIKTLN